MSLGRAWWGWAIAAAVGLGLLSANDAGGFRRYVALREQAKALDARNRRLAEDNDRLAREIEAMRKDPKALERTAREELNYVRPGEIVFNLEQR